MQSDILNNIEVTSKQRLKILLPFLVYFLLYFLFFLPASSSIISYSIVYISTSFAFIFLCLYLFKLHLPKNYFYVLIIAAFILRICVLFIQPTGSDDYYRYVWDGKVLANGINPYQYAPADPELTKLHSDILPRLVKYPEIKTIYPPLSQEIFYLGYLIGGESFGGIKILLFLFELLTLTGLYLILKELKFPSKFLLIYMLAPLPIFQFLIDAHVDGFGLTFLIFAILFYLRKQLVFSLIFIGLSACIKPLGLVLLPILFFTEKGIKSKIQILLIPLITCVLMYLPFLITVSFSGIFEALGNFTVNWTFNGFVFEILNSFLNDNQKARLICGILFLLAYIPVIFSKKDFLNKVYISVFLLLIFSPIVHPWYVTWLAVLLPFIPGWSGILYINLVSLTVITVLNYQLYDVWKNYPLVLIIEYVPVLLIFLYEIFFNRNIITSFKKQSMKI